MQRTFITITPLHLSSGLVGHVVFFMAKAPKFDILKSTHANAGFGVREFQPEVLRGRNDISV